MEKTYKRVPFDIELAKKIQAGEVEGRIVTNHDVAITLLDTKYRFGGEYNIPVIWHWEAEHNELVLYNNKGECKNSHSDCYLHIELPEDAPKHEFKPFDKVLVRRPDDYYGTINNKWVPAYYQLTIKENGVFGEVKHLASGILWKDILPYEGNEHLVGTTNNPE